MRTILSILALAIIFSACKKDQDLSNKPATLGDIIEFSSSPFYDTIPASAELDPNSSSMVSNLVKEANRGFNVCVKEWTVPVYWADGNTQKSDVKFTRSWAPKDKLKDVPIPDFAEADPESDGHMVIVDTENGCVYDFWEMRYKSGRWKAGWGNALPLSGDGIFPDGFSARGSGFELLQGVIWPQELIAGEINHALIFSFDYTRSGGPVSPATESDGTTDGNSGIPEGALVQLDPNLDLSTLDLNSYELTIATALQKYGMYCADDGGGLSLYAINPISVSTNPYQNIWGDNTYIDMIKIPADKFRVLKMSAQLGDTEPEIVSNSCAVYK